MPKPKTRTVQEDFAPEASKQILPERLADAAPAQFAGQIRVHWAPCDGIEISLDENPGALG